MSASTAYRVAAACCADSTVDVDAHAARIVAVVVSKREERHMKRERIQERKRFAAQLADRSAPTRFRGECLLCSKPLKRGGGPVFCDDRCAERGLELGQLVATLRESA